MRSDFPSTKPTTSIGDGAVEGLLLGLLAGLFMAAYLLAASLLIQPTPGALLRTLTATVGASPTMVVLGHFALSAFYGVVWGFSYRFLLRRLAVPAWAWGLLYGALLWLCATLLLPSGITLPLAVTGSAHLVFGAALGILSTIQSSKGKDSA